MNGLSNLIIITIAITVLISLVVLILLIIKYQKKKMTIKVRNLDVIKNEILSLPFNLTLEKINNLTKGEQIEEKIDFYKKKYEDIKNVEFKKIDDQILELELIINSKRRKEFNDRYFSITLSLYKYRYIINHMMNQINELTSYEDKYRGIVIKLKNKYRIISREFENNLDLYGTLRDTIKMQFENIDKRFQDFEIVINENLYNEVVLVVNSLDDMIKHIGALVLEVPDILVLVNDLIPSRIKELKVLKESMNEEGFSLNFMNFDNNFEQIEIYENDVLDRSKVLNIDNSLLALKTILEFLDSLFKDIEKEKTYKKDFDKTINSLNERLEKSKQVINNIYSELDDIKVMYGLKDDDFKDLNDISLSYNELFKDYRAILRVAKKQLQSYGKINLSLNELGIKLKYLEDDLDLSLKGLGSMQDDEERARDQLEDVQDLLKKCRRIIQSVKIPVISNDYFVQLSEANEAILEIIKELEKKPIIIKTLNTRVDTARDLSIKLYNTTNNIIKKSYCAENLIVYANRYRSLASDINRNINKSEVLFYKGNYDNSLKLILDILEKIEPGIKGKFNKILE